MRTSFRSGIVRHQTDLHGSAIFLKQTGTNGSVSIIVSPDPTIITFIDGSTDYLYTEYQTVTDAWLGPFSTSMDHYLYWELNRVTGLISYGSTQYDPVISAVAPTGVNAGQFWFDTINKKWFMYSGVSWTQKLIVFAARLALGTTLGSMSDQAPSYIGTQVGINTSQSVGSLVYDLAGKPLQNSLGQFFTTEDDFIAGVPYGSSMRIEALATYAIVQEPLSKYMVVRFHDFNKIVPASASSQLVRTIGLVEEDAVQGDRVRVVYAGPVTNEDWDWSTYGVDAPIYVTNTGELSPSPGTINQQPVARVIGRRTILFQPWLGALAVSESEGGGVTDHGGLMGLLDDDHPQYHNDTRGDARYYTQPTADATFAPIDHSHTLDGLYDVITSGSPALQVGDVIKYNGVNWVPASDTGVSDHTLLTNIGTNTHVQIDTHIASTSNPHNTDLGGLTDVDLAGSPLPATGDVLKYNGANWIHGSLPSFTIPYDMAFFIGGAMADGTINDLVGGFIATRNVSISVNFPGSVAKATTAATAETIYSVTVNGVQRGTITFAVAGTTGTFATTTGAFSLVAGDIVNIVNPGSLDATIADVYVTIVGCASITPDSCP